MACTKLAKLALNGMGLNGKPLETINTHFGLMFMFWFCAGPPIHETLRLLLPLTSLEYLNLDGNKLGGSIAPDLATSMVATFVKLKTLSLCGMGLEGELPKTLGANLSVLLLAGNGFHGAQ